MVYAGNNDVIYDFAAYAIGADQIATQQTAGTLTAAQAAAQLAQLKQAVEADVTQTAKDLATDVETQIVAKGGVYIAVMTLSDIGDTPFGHAFPDELRAELTNLSLVFNSALRPELADAPVKVIDTYALFKDIYTHPGKGGFVNNTTPACDVDKIVAITGGISRRQLFPLLQRHAGRTVQRTDGGRRPDHLAVRRQPASDHRRSSGHCHDISGSAAILWVDLRSRRYHMGSIDQHGGIAPRGAAKRLPARTDEQRHRDQTKRCDRLSSGGRKCPVP